MNTAAARTTSATTATPLPWLHAAVRTGADQAFALAIPEVSVAAMQPFLDHFAATLAGGVHAALLLDGAAAAARPA